MKKIYPFLFCLCFAYWSCVSGKSLIEPTTDFCLNFTNFPHAWTISRGEGARIGIVAQLHPDSFDWEKFVQRAAPDSSVEVFDKTEFLRADGDVLGSDILLIVAALTEGDYSQALQAMEACGKKGITVILPAYFGPMTEESVSNQWVSFVKKASSLEAIIVGIHGLAYQLGDLEFWKKVPVDCFALSRRVDGDGMFGIRAKISTSGLEESSYLVAGAAALLKGKRPELTSLEIKRIFQERGRKVIWMISDVLFGQDAYEYRAWPLLSREQLERRERDLVNSGHRVLEIFEGNCFDAALSLGLKPMGSGEWTANALRLNDAHKLATGKDVVVAILDHMFDAEDPSLERRIVKPGSVLEGAPVFDPETSSGHGTWMARHLVQIAPHVKIMPVRFCGRGRFGDPDLYINGIAYAVQNGADIVSISHQPIPEHRQSDFDEAVAKAAEKGVTVVYIHYRGERKDIVATKPIEFAPFYKGEEHVYVIGTNSVDEMSFPYTWGFSQTAPYVAGVIALMKEINPDLSPSDISQILLDSGRPLASGFQILDAFEAVNSSKSFMR